MFAVPGGLVKRGIITDILQFAFTIKSLFKIPLFVDVLPSQDKGDACCDSFCRERKPHARSSCPPELTGKPVTCGSSVDDEQLMIPLAQANSQLFQTSTVFHPSPPRKVRDPLSVVRALKCSRNLRRNPNGDVSCKSHRNGEGKKKSVRGFHFQEINTAFLFSPLFNTELRVSEEALRLK